MASSPRTAFARLRDLAASGELGSFCAERDIALFVVFGSVLEPDPVRPPEDLDVAILFDPGGTADFITLITALTSRLRLDAVDVMDLGRAGVVARAEALAGLPLYESRAGLFAERQMAALTERMETAWLRRLDLDLLAR